MTTILNIAVPAPRLVYDMLESATWCYESSDEYCRRNSTLNVKINRRHESTHTIVL